MSRLIAQSKQKDGGDVYYSSQTFDEGPMVEIERLQRDKELMMNFINQDEEEIHSVTELATDENGRVYQARRRKMNIVEGVREQEMSNAHDLSNFASSEEQKQLKDTAHNMSCFVR